MPRGRTLLADCAACGLVEAQYDEDGDGPLTCLECGGPATCDELDEAEEEA